MRARVSAIVASAIRVLAIVLASAAPALARADAVGMFDPELARVCGGSAHDPRCSSELLGLCCCGGFVLVAMGVAVFFTMGRRER